MIVTIRVGDRIKIWLQGQSAPLWVEVREIDAAGFPVVVVEDSGQRRKFSRSRVEYAVLVHQTNLAGPA